MAGFTSEEVQEKIQQFLLGQVRVQRTRIGNRDVLALKDEVFTLLTTALLLRPDSFFYIISRTVNRFEALRRKQVVDVQTIIDSLTGTSRRGTPIGSTADLSNAQAALLNINAGLNGRSNTGIRGSIGPGVDRFQRATDRFLRDELAPNIVDGGQVVETAEELRTLIAEKLANILERHEEMVSLAHSLSSALTELDGVRLPQQTVQGIVSRISNRLIEVIEEMSGTDALAKARNDALDLFVMRSLLTRASSFRTPSLVKAPGVGDSTTMTLTAGATPGEVLGTVSGPFNYPSGTDLDVETGSGGVLASYVVPGGSRASITTGSLPFDINFGAGADIVFTVDDTALVAISYSGMVLRSTVASQLDTALGAAGSVTEVGDTLVIESASAGDESSVEFSQSNANRQLAVAILAPTFIYTKGTPVFAADIVEAINADAVMGPHVEAEELFTDYGTFSGLTTTTVGQEDRLLVDGQDFTGVPVGARVQLTSGTQYNRGYYRVVSGAVGYLQVDRDLPDRPDDVSFNVFTSFLKLKATGAGPTDGIRVTTAGDFTTATGLAVDASLNKGLVNTGTISNGDLLTRGVRVGDLLLLDGGSAESAPVLTAVGRQQVTFDPGFPYESGATTVVPYEIRSFRYQQYRFLLDGTSLRKGITAWLEQWEDVTELERRVAQVVRGGTERQAQPLLQAFLDSSVGGIPPAAPVPANVPDLVTLQEDTDSYVVPFENTIDNILRLLAEQGMDRALELLLTLDIQNFFTMPAEGVSFSTWLNRKAAEAARVVAPVSKFARGEKAITEYEPLGSQPDPFDPSTGDISDFLVNDEP